MRGLLSLTAALARAAWRGWRARPVLAFLNVTGLAIGVAVYLAIRIVNHSATRSFQAGIDLVAGRSDLEVTAPGGLEEELFFQIAATPGVKAASPVVEGHAILPGRPGEYLRVIGVDPFTAGPFFEPVSEDGGGEWGLGTEDWLARGGSVLLNRRQAGRLGLRKDDTFSLSLGGRIKEVRVAGTFAPREDDGASNRVAFLDIGWAQELLESAGKLSAVQIIAEDSAGVDSLGAALRARLPAGVKVEPPARRNRQVAQMLQGFQLNLTALSLVSLLVGVFLIGSTISASVVRQRREIGVLRAVGASRGQVRAVFLLEAALSALAGGLLGIPLAKWIAGLLLGGVSQAISMHYVLLSIDTAWLSGRHVAEALLAALGAALLGAWGPAGEAGGVDPVAVLRPGRTIEPNPPPLRRSLIQAAVCLTLSAALAERALHSGPAWLSFAACLLLVLGFARLARPAARLAAGAAERISAFSGWNTARMGAAQMGKSLHRGAPVIASLLAAVAMVLGVSIMIHSFRGTLGLWMDGTLRADIYTAPAANEIIPGSATLPADLTDALRADPRVSAVETLRQERVTLPDGGEYVLRAERRPAGAGFAFPGAGAAAKQTRWRLPDHVAVSEILARRFGWREGDRIPLSTPAGPREFIVAGVFTDYSDDRGCLAVTAENHARYWPESGLHAVAAYLKNPADAPGVEDMLRERFGARGELAIYANAKLRGRVNAIFDQTFAVTELLRVIAVAVAMLGIALAMSTLVTERAWDIAALRSIGASRAQVAVIHLAESGLLGFTAAALGMLCGLLLSMILTWVVNPSFFGWSIRLLIPWRELLLTPLWVTPVALFAGLLPAWKAAGTRLSSALRTE